MCLHKQARSINGLLSKCQWNVALEGLVIVSVLFWIFIYDLEIEMSNMFINFWEHEVDSHVHIFKTWEFYRSGLEEVKMQFSKVLWLEITAEIQRRTTV